MFIQHLIDLDELQQKAVEAWKQNNNIGTIELVTGHGKTFIAFKALLTTTCTNVLFVSESTLREKNVMDDADKFHKLFGVHPFENKNVKFQCYQSTYKYNIDYYFKDATEKNTFIIFDEIHELLTPVYFKFAEQLIGKLYPRIGLSATIDKDITYGEVSKLDYLNSFCPIIFSYGLNDAYENKTIRNLKLIVYHHKLDNTLKTVDIKTTKHSFKTTEFENYFYVDRLFKKALFLPTSNTSKEFLIRRYSKQRSEILYTLQSKIEIAKKILNLLIGKTIIFNNNLDTLYQLTNEVVCSRNTANVNKSILSDFDQSRIQTIASFKMLEQGVNLSDLDNVLILSYYSKSKSFIQRIGRLRKSNKTGNIIMFVTDHTQEEVWFNKLTEELDIPIIHVHTLDELKNKLYA